MHSVPVLAFLLLGCGTGEVGGLDSGQYNQDLAQPDAAIPGRTLVFAHTADTLYRVDPSTLAVTMVAQFVWPADTADNRKMMTDIAVDRTGRIVGVSFENLYLIDPRNGECTRLAPLSGSFNALTFIANAGGTEDLLAASEGVSGQFAEGVYRLDTSTGQQQLLGNFGNGLISSGDMVSVRNVGTLATVRKTGSATDWLAKVDPARGNAELIGDTGQERIWGLGFWGNRVFGFTDAGALLLIDPKTGQTRSAAQTGIAWWGAGVTTEATVDL